ncbi:hypothetical protein EYC84_011590 [Monilinia fructicola]|uniref:Uncharacterized protein n=1 Tax=Monilinia fructicola TaxID=38448 RepID=A0A5M9JAK3_MONFR|nr:hypothetical protein EYC84_011590 [Monilinia fructicola]
MACIQAGHIRSCSCTTRGRIDGSIYFTALIFFYQIFRLSFITHLTFHTSILIFLFLVTTFEIQLVHAHMLRDQRKARK